MHKSRRGKSDTEVTQTTKRLTAKPRTTSVHKQTGGLIKRQGGRTGVQVDQADLDVAPKP